MFPERRTRMLRRNWSNERGSARPFLNEDSDSGFEAGEANSLGVVKLIEEC